MREILYNIDKSVVNCIGLSPIMTKCDIREDAA